MLNTITPNRAIFFAVAAPVVYWILATFISPTHLRDVFNGLAFGVAVIIVLTWAQAAAKAVKENAAGGAWQLILAIFIVWFVTMCQRSYIIIYNWYDRPDSWTNSAISGFWPYSYLIAGLLFISAPGARTDGLQGRSIWAMVTAIALGSLLAGILIGASISSV